MTTVGFGDYAPKTPFGMIFGGMCTVASVLMIDLPMPIIVENFANYYNHLQARSKFPKKLRRKVLDVQAPRTRQHAHAHLTSGPSTSSNVNAVSPLPTIALMTNKFGATVSLLKRESIVNPSGISKMPKMA